MMDIESIYQLFIACNGITTDSRHCPAGSMFVALKGSTFNGNVFAAETLEKGCSHALVDEAEYATDSRIVLVEDCLQTLRQLAALHRQKMAVPVIGITGTNGKTTTKELISAVLSQKYTTLCTQGNLNNHIGVPLTLLRLKPTDEIAVVEMGANHPGEIESLANIAQPDYGIITNVGRAHLEGFGSFEGVVHTKGELYDYLRSRTPKGTIFIDNDNTTLKEIAHNLRQIPYALTAKGARPFVTGHLKECSPFLSFVWEKDGKEYSVNTQLIGSYNLKNALAAIAIGDFFGVEPEKICSAISRYTPRNNRSQLIKTERNTLIVDAYNANPTSMAAALDNFTQMQCSPKMLLLGDMKELGRESLAEHQKIAEYIAEKTCFDTVWLIGEQFSKVAQEGQRTFAHTGAAEAALLAEQPAGCNILIKGSNSMHLDRLVNLL